MKQTHTEPASGDTAALLASRAPGVSRTPGNDVEDSNAGTAVKPKRWDIRDIDFHAIDLNMARADETLLALVAASSMIESASDVYTANLVEYYSTDSEIGNWLAAQWQPEELQHGEALRTYIASVWPAFDWETTFKAFIADYGKYCVAEALGPTRALELAARCVVETGTATLYRAIHEYAREPVLRDIVHRISEDEVGHFKHFYRYFKKYQGCEKLSRYDVAKALLGRIAEVRRDDAACAFRHVFAGRFPEAENDEQRLRSWSENVYRMVKRHYPYPMAVKMLLTPLDLPPKVKPLVGAPLAFTVRLIMWGL
jgi:hypothetical protein